MWLAQGHTADERKTTVQILWPPIHSTKLQTSRATVAFLFKGNSNTIIHDDLKLSSCQQLELFVSLPATLLSLLLGCAMGAAAFPVAEAVPLPIMATSPAHLMQAMSFLMSVILVLVIIMGTQSTRFSFCLVLATGVGHLCRWLRKSTFPRDYLLHGSRDCLAFAPYYPPSSATAPSQSKQAFGQGTCPQSLGRILFRLPVSTSENAS